MISSRWFLLVLILPALVGISGCSEGETIPLVPAGNICERPVDRAWQNLTSICGDRDALETVWPRGGMPVVVGADGLIVECDAGSQWSVIDLSIRDDLRKIVSDDDGNVLVAGSNSALAYRLNGTWQTMDSPAETNWYDVRANGNQMWLAGRYGMLATGTLGGPWQLVDFPDSTSLYAVCAFEDSVYVAGADGLLKVLVDGQWSDCPSPDIDGWGINSIVRLDDGRLVILSGYIWVRELDGWVKKESIGYGYNNHLRVHDGYLWFPGYSNSYRLDTSSEPWGVLRYDGYGYSLSLAPGPDAEAFTVSRDGEFTWFSPAAQDSVTRWIDPAGYLETAGLYRLIDDSVVFPVDGGLFEVTPDAIERVEFQSPDADLLLEYSTRIRGASVDDFYTISSGSKLSHFLNGELVLDQDLPDDLGSFKSFQANSSGRICVVFWNGISLWSDDGWEIRDDVYNPRVFMIQDQDFLVTDSRRTMYLSEHGEALINLRMTPNIAWEIEPGVIGFLNDDFTFERWDVGSELGPLLYLDPLPGCTRLYVNDFTETPAGVFITLSGHSMVLKFPYDPARADWDLVAGPCFNQISDLEILADGTLVALDSGQDYIMIYPSPNN